MDAFPIWLLLVFWFALILLSVEVGYRLGARNRRSKACEKESPLSTIAGAVLALLAFVLAFTFSMASSRYDMRKELVRDEANAIQSAWLQTDFLTADAAVASRTLLNHYLSSRLDAMHSFDLAVIRAELSESANTQRELWDIGVAEHKISAHADAVGAYLQSLTEIANLHDNRVAVEVQLRIPMLIWWVLGVLMVVGMSSVGYQSAISGSKRSWATPLLGFSFAVVFTLISLLDRPVTRALPISHEPLVLLQEWFSEEMGQAPAASLAPAATSEKP